MQPDFTFHMAETKLKLTEYLSISTLNTLRELYVGHVLKMIRSFAAVASAKISIKRPPLKHYALCRADAMIMKNKPKKPHLISYQIKNIQLAKPTAPQKDDSDF